MYQTLMFGHLATVLPAAVIGAYLLLSRKGTPVHKGLGKVYALLMLATALIVLFMPAEVGPRLLEHFGFIHIFSIIVLASIPRAISAARKRDIRGHKSAMLGVYFGGIMIAGSLAFMPGRFLHQLLFG